MNLMRIGHTLKFEELKTAIPSTFQQQERWCGTVKKSARSWKRGAIKEVFVIFCSHLLSLAWVPKTMIEFIDREKMTHLLFQRKLDEVFSMKRRKVVGANRAMAGGILETLGAPGTKPVEYRRLRDGKGEEEEKEEVSVVLVLVKVFKRFRPVPTLRKRRQTDQSRWPSDCLQARTCSSCG